MPDEGQFGTNLAFQSCFWTGVGTTSAVFIALGVLLYFFLKRYQKRARPRLERQPVSIKIKERRKTPMKRILPNHRLLRPSMTIHEEYEPPLSWIVINNIIN